MKNLILIMVLSVIGTGLFAQEKTKEEQKKDKEAIKVLQFNETKALLDSRKFVLEADYLIDRSGQRTPADQSLNFIMVDSAQAMLQNGKTAGMGANGVGGVSLTGNITSWKVESNEKKKSFSVQMNVLTDNGFLTVFMSISPGHNTKASVTGNQWLAKYDYEGRLVKLEESGAYKGRTLFRN
jgi:hypothetical protein